MKTNENSSPSKTFDPSAFLFNWLWMLRHGLKLRALFFLIINIAISLRIFIQFGFAGILLVFIAPLPIITVPYLIVLSLGIPPGWADFAVANNLANSSLTIIMIFNLIASIYLGFSSDSLKKNKSNSKIQIAWAAIIIGLLFVFFQLFSLTNRSSAEAFNRCVDVLKKVENAENDYYKVFNRFTDNPDLLAAYMIAGCKDSANSECAAALRETIYKDCLIGKFNIETQDNDSIYKISARAQDRYRCPICVTKKGIMPKDYSKCNESTIMVCLE